MQSGFALPLSTCSIFLGKLTHTSFEYFNLKVYNLHDRARDMEHNYKLTNPRRITFDSEYN